MNILFYFFFQAQCLKMVAQGAATPEKLAKVGPDHNHPEVPVGQCSCPLGAADGESL